MYHPTLGRWLTTDPIGFAAGDSNFYNFVGNNPSNMTDPLGLAPPSDLGSAIINGLLGDSLWSNLNRVGFHLQFYFQAIRPELIKAMRKLQDAQAFLGIMGCVSAQIVSIHSLRVSEVSVIPPLNLVAPGLPKALQWLISDQGIGSVINSYLADYRSTWNASVESPVEVVSNCGNGRRCGDKWDCKVERLTFKDLPVTRRLTDFIPADKLPNTLADGIVNFNVTVSVDVKMCTAACGCNTNGLGALVGGGGIGIK